MKFAVIKTGGKQYLVKEGDKLKVEKLPETKGDVTFEEVLMTDDGSKATVGKPLVSGAKVTAKRVADSRHDKIMVVKYKNKTRYRVKRGHRQPYTEVEISKIS
jgi:large subunit ribosomal protein L21